MKQSLSGIIHINSSDNTSLKEAIRNQWYTRTVDFWQRDSIHYLWFSLICGKEWNSSSYQLTLSSCYHWSSGVSRTGNQKRTWGECRRWHVIKTYKVFIPLSEYSSFNHWPYPSRTLIRKQAKESHQSISPIKIWQLMCITSSMHRRKLRAARPQSSHLKGKIRSTSITFSMATNGYQELLPKLWNLSPSWLHWIKVWESRHI